MGANTKFLHKPYAIHCKSACSAKMLHFLCASCPHTLIACMKSLRLPCRFPERWKMSAVFHGRSTCPWNLRQDRNSRSETSLQATLTSFQRSQAGGLLLARQNYRPESQSHSLQGHEDCFFCSN